MRTCAWCRRFHKSGCTANTQAESRPLTSVTVPGLKGTVSMLWDKVDELQTRVQETKGIIRSLQGEWIGQNTFASNKRNVSNTAVFDWRAYVESCRHVPNGNACIRLHRFARLLVILVRRRMQPPTSRMPQTKPTKATNRTQKSDLLSIFSSRCGFTTIVYHLNITINSSLVNPTHPRSFCSFSKSASAPTLTKLCFI